MPVMELMVLMAERPSAPPFFTARATVRMSVMLGVSLTSTGRAGDLFDPMRDLLGVLGDLADGRAHATFGHAVRAAEVQLQTVGAGVFGALHDVVPRLGFGLDHQRGDDGILGIAALDLGNLAEVDVDGAVGDELDVVETHHALAGEVDGGVAGADVGDGLADGLPDGSAPASVEGAHDLLAAVGGRSGGEPEGVGRVDAEEAAADVSHAVGLHKHFRRMIAAAMPRAARLPSATASTTSRPPLTQSPPAKYLGWAVWPVIRLMTMRPRSIWMPRSSPRNASRGDWPMAGMTMSQEMRNCEPGIGL